MSFFSLRHLVTIVTSESMRPSFGRGDILISFPASQNVTVGDVVLVQVSIATIVLINFVTYEINILETKHCYFEIGITNR